MSDFAFVSRNSITKVFFTVYDGTKTAVAADAAVTVSFKDYPTDTEQWTRAATAEAETGLYSVTVSSIESATPGLFYIDWTYDLGAIAQAWRTDVEIPSLTNSAYEGLSAESRAIVDLTWIRFEDMFDSAYGGPHLREYAQANFGRDRMAQLLRIALGRLNTTSQPHYTFSMEANDFPFAEWGGLLELALYVESIRHLIRSYTEQPTAQGVQTVRLDRKDYANAWRAILQDEEKGLRDAMDSLKAALMFSGGKSSVLVGGGIYGEWASPGPVSRPRYRPPVRLW